MAHLLRRLCPGGGMAFLGLGTDLDTVHTPGYEQLEEKPTGWDGVQQIFRKNKYGEPSPYLTTIVHMSSLGCFGGVVMGAVLYGRKAYQDFMENNHATMFVDHWEARRKLQDTIIVSMGKGGLKWGYRIGMFSLLFISTNVAMNAYFGYPTIIAYTTAGVVAGSLFKTHLGPKGMISGAVAGALCGTLGGIVSIGVLKASGVTLDDIAKCQEEFKHWRETSGDEAMRKHFTEEQEELHGAVMNRANQSTNTKL